MLTLYNFDLNFKLDYRLINTKNIELFGSVGFITEYVVDDEHKSTRNDGSVTYKIYNYYTDDAFPSTITGANASLIAKYKLNGHLGITFSPEYSIFLRKFDSNNSGAYQRIGANIGVEYTF